jgi:alpha-ketoglutarate-dependent taurine dioxygenase
VFDSAGGEGTLAPDTVLWVSIWPHRGRLVLRLRYRTDVLDAGAAARIAGYHLTALEQIAADTGAQHDQQSLLSQEEFRFQFTARPGIKLVNAYGLTETSDDTNHEVMDRAPDGDRVTTSCVPARPRRPGPYCALLERKTEMTDSSLASFLDLDLPAGEPPVVRADSRSDAADWAAGHRDALRAAVAEHGCVLVRGLGLSDAAGAGAVFGRLADSLMNEMEAFAPRQPLAPGVYSATPWPPQQQMCMHHELSYRLEFPGLLLFACLSPAVSGGGTAVADAAAMLSALPADLVQRFEREGWILDRTYGEDFGASCEESFGTGDRGAIESYCRANDIEFTWQPDGELRTRQRRSAVVRHPLTGQRCWFNQIGFLSEWTMDPEVREYLIDLYGEDGLPFTTRFGNGDPVTEDIVQLLNETYEANSSRVSWQAGDLLLVDNIRTAHSREPYEGPREILAGLADPVRLADVSPGTTR